ncbi:dual E2 ubiquitin-conjugating enzyme/E3 ubiquitin-protein ligase BIRC6-like isoform X4 [Peromyscus maniculatus bairdii]|uniref:dual E2 ubiquitin-conjugating enzyme/E3 ubiquitin-protein ligase BIRC6-like isoform X4 n=1 Tax=Peromyscus maniculatus bairdii TaxID=230844 RepID=UPI003FD62E43
MASAEQQLQVLQEKQWQLLKLQQQKAKLEAKLHQTTAAAAAASASASAAGPVHNSVPSNPVAAPGFFIHPFDVIPPTPKTTPLFMTPPLTPPNEAVSVVINAELAQLFPGSVIDPPAVNLAAHNKNSNKSRMNPLGSGLALAISHASHFSSASTSPVHYYRANAFSQEIYDLGFWKTYTIDGCTDSHLWRLGLLIN